MPISLDQSFPSEQNGTPNGTDGAGFAAAAPKSLLGTPIPQARQTETVANGLAAEAMAAAIDAQMADHLERLFSHPERGLLSLTGDVAINAISQAREKLAEIVDEALDTVSDPVARKLARPQLLRRINRTKARLDRLEERVARSWRDETSMTRIAAAQAEVIGDPTDPSLLTEGLRLIRAELGRLAAVQGWESKLLAERITQADRAMLSAAGGRLIEIGDLTALTAFRKLLSKHLPKGMLPLIDRKIAEAALTARVTEDVEKAIGKAVKAVDGAERLEDLDGAGWRIALDHLKSLTGDRRSEAEAALQERRAGILLERQERQSVVEDQVRRVLVRRIHGLQVDDVPGPSAFTAAYGAVAGAELHQEVRQTDRRLREVLGGRTGTVRSVLDTLKNPQLTELIGLALAAQERHTAPAAVVTKTDPDLAAMASEAVEDPARRAVIVARSLRVQRLLGVSRPRPLPDAMSDALITEWQTAPEAAARLHLVEELLGEAGDGAGAVLAQLVEAGLPAGLQTLLPALSAGRRGLARRLITRLSASAPAANPQMDDPGAEAQTPTGGQGGGIASLLDAVAGGSPKPAPGGAANPAPRGVANPSPGGPPNVSPNAVDIPSNLPV